MADVPQPTPHSSTNTMAVPSEEKSVGHAVSPKTNPMPPLKVAPIPIPLRLRTSPDERARQELSTSEEFNVQGDLGLPISAAPSVPRPTDNVVASPKKLEEFTLFPNLPIELRLKIVKTAHPILARVIHVRSVNYSHDFLVKEGRSTAHVSVKPTSIPTLLCINQELRDEYLRFYPSPFTSDNFTPIDPDLRLHDESRRTERVANALRINFQLDTIYLDRCNFTANNAKRPLDLLFASLFGATEVQHVRKQIKYLAVDSGTAADIQMEHNNRHLRPGPNNRPYRALHEYGHLKEFSIVDGYLGRGFKLFGLREIEAVDKGDLKRWFTDWLTKVEGCENSVVKVVALDQKYFKHKLMMPYILKGDIEGALRVGRLPNYNR